MTTFETTTGTKIIADAQAQQIAAEAAALRNVIRAEDRAKVDRAWAHLAGIAQRNLAQGM